MTRLLIVDDDVELCNLLREYLGKEGFEVETTHQGQGAAGLALAPGIALVVLDVMLPGMSGFDVLRQIRAQSRVPVLMLTARGEEVDRIVGLELGADDYLAKPFNPRELVARLRAVLRRSGPPEGPEAAAGPLAVGDLQLDPGARTVKRRGKEIVLTGLEFNILEVLLRAAGQLVSRDDLTRQALGRALTPFDRSLDVHLSNIRRKLGPLPGGRERIKTVRGIGYLYVRPDQGGGV